MLYGNKKFLELDILHSWIRMKKVLELDIL
jgi:hypothetical protein